jgi:hypothetical protein
LNYCQHALDPVIRRSTIQCEPDGAKYRLVPIAWNPVI